MQDVVFQPRYHIIITMNSWKQVQIIWNAVWYVAVFLFVDTMRIMLFLEVIEFFLKKRLKDVKKAMSEINQHLGLS